VQANAIVRQDGSESASTLIAVTEVPRKSCMCWYVNMQNSPERNVHGTSFLVLTPTVPALRRADQLFIDDKALAGLRLYSKYWPGRVRCIFRASTEVPFPFGSWHDPALLPCEVVVLPDGALVPDSLLQDAAVVLGSGDSHLDFALSGQCGKLGVPLVFGIENILETRLQIIALAETPLTQRLKSMLWTIRSELYRRRAFKRADALQANGTPAAKRYSGVNRKILMYFDTRLSTTMIASESDIAAKEARREAGPIRLAFSGRLERLKGADHLPLLAERLVAMGVDFRFDIFGTGSLSSLLERTSQRRELARRLVIHGPVDFETHLVPWMRNHADLFICCHRQSDPSCTYMETLGCAVPIIAYRNLAFEGIMNIADVGWLIEKDNLGALADQIAAVAADRKKIDQKARSGVALATKHSFEATFFNRVEHLRSVAFRDRTSLR
jgi:colanic acid/amylovoran biosynthesis glycosyltransferase